ncbi:hypothetical protein [Ruegeria jejuensis]|uniref:hypothetical protein n=1 Tax=Ruegeria jejuensis TaxID=3233338 RepID=UPI00355BDC0D
MSNSDKAPPRIWAHCELDEDDEWFIEFLSDEPWPGEDPGVEFVRADARPTAQVKAYQSRVHDWILTCFGEEIGADKVERNHRFLEEALELVQAGGCTKSEAMQLVDYVYGREIGELGQEVGGVMNTLAALCTAHGVSLDAEAERELARVWTKVEKIRAKQAAKPKHSPLPQYTQTGLREAAIVNLIETAQWARNRLEAIADKSWHGDARDFKRALIGVFADFDEALKDVGSEMPPTLRALAEEGDT